MISYMGSPRIGAHELLVAKLAGVRSLPCVFLSLVIQSQMVVLKRLVAKFASVLYPIRSNFGSVVRMFGLHVVSKEHSVRKSLVASWTRHPVPRASPRNRIFAHGVPLHVRRHAALLSESSAANRTHELLLGQMNDFVILLVRTLSEPFAADVTLEGPVSSMGAHVNVERFRPLERLPADGAHLLPLRPVHPHHVAPEPGPVQECLPALLARQIRAVAVAVTQRVRDEVGLVDEPLAALAALEGPVVVPPLVDFQVLRCPEDFSAEFTGEERPFRILGARLFMPVFRGGKGKAEIASIAPAM